MKKNTIILALSATLLALGSLNTFAQPADWAPAHGWRSGQKGAHGQQKGLARKLILINVSKDTDATVTIEDKTLTATALRGRVEALFPNGFGKAGDIFRLKIKDALGGECNEQIRFARGQGIKVLSCPNLKTKIAYTMTRRGNAIVIKFSDEQRAKTALTEDVDTGTDTEDTEDETTTEE